MEIGTKSTLTIDRFTSVGAYLVDSNGNDILLPQKYIPFNVEVGNEIEVFIYTDSEDRPIATTLTPYAEKNEFAWLQVVHVSEFGAFLDIGLEKDILVPFKEQNAKMEADKSYLVFVYLDQQTQRLVATAKINKYLAEDTSNLEENQKVSLLIGAKTPLGFQVIIDQTYKGIIFEDRLTRNLISGEKTEGYIEKIREDGKLDVSLEPVGIEKFENNEAKIMNFLEENDGTLFLHDKSSPEEIRELMEMSKKSFKKAIGALYKKKKIKINDSSVELI